jgi:membrane associated rhomboid family serine protease
LLALASTLVFTLIEPRDRATLNEAARFYVDSGLAAIELPLYREYLTQSPDPDAVDRLAQLERAAGQSIGRPTDPVQAIEVLRGDRSFDRELHADNVVTASEPHYPEWKRNRQYFDQLTRSRLVERMALSGQSWREPWRLVTALFLHPAAPLWLTNLLVLLLVGPFAEAAAGAALFLLCYLGAGAFSAATSLLFSVRPAVGDWACLAALAAMLAVAFGTRPMSARLIGSRGDIAMPAIAALLVVIGVEALRWALVARAATDLSADLSGLAFGAALAGIFKLRDSRRVRDLAPVEHPADSDGPKESALARQAREAATRMETRRATELYKELVDLEPRHVEHLSAYLSTALLGPDETSLQDAALRLLWLRSKSHSDQLRKAYLQLTQPKVLKVLPIDEHLRLARRLVKLREDAAALKVLDAILSDNHLRQLYGRQLADCLLGIYTGYVRRRLTTLAETIRSRLTQYFEVGDKLGGLPPATRPPTTMFTSSMRPPNTRGPR